MRYVPTLLTTLHDLSLAAWSGGALMGAVGVNSATIEVDDHTQRIRVADAAWFRWAPVAGLCVVTHLAAAIASGRVPVPGRAGRHVPLAQVRSAVTAAAVLATAASGHWGHRVVGAGDVPVATATRPIAATPDHVAAAQHRLRRAQWAVPALTAALWIVDAAQRTRQHTGQHR